MKTVGLWTARLYIYLLISSCVQDRELFAYLSKESLWRSSYRMLTLMLAVVGIVLSAVGHVESAVPTTSSATPTAEEPGPSGCCDWPSCYDERVQLCLDTWTQCPAKLFLMTCYSPYMSPFGELPLQCFPDAAPHIHEAEERGLSGTPQKIRDELHKINVKNCHPETGICRPQPT